MLDKLVNVFKKLLPLKSNKLIIAYFLILLVLVGIFSDVIDKRLISWQFRLSHVRSEIWLKQYFIEYTFWYTLLLLVPFVYCLHLSIGNGNLDNAIVPLCRVLIGYLVLYIIGYRYNAIAVFFRTENKIKGQVYHNIYGILSILEEAKWFYLWGMVNRLTNTNPARKELKASDSDQSDPQIRAEHPGEFAKKHVKYMTFLKFNFCALGLLVLILIVANLLCIYYYNFYDIILSAVVAGALWFIVYRVISPRYYSGSCSIEAQLPMVEELNKTETSENIPTSTTSYGTV